MLCLNYFLNRKVQVKLLRVRIIFALFLFFHGNVSCLGNVVGLSREELCWGSRVSLIINFESDICVCTHSHFERLQEGRFYIFLVSMLIGINENKIALFGSVACNFIHELSLMVA